MLDQLLAFLKAGDPPHYVYAIAVLYALVEWALGRSDKIQPNSALALIAHALLVVLARVPGVGPILAWMAQPASPPEKEVRP